jgi:hypothetical protein
MTRQDRQPQPHDRTPVDPADPLVVRYADRSRGWGRAMDRIDARVRTIRNQVNQRDPKVRT